MAYTVVTSEMEGFLNETQVRPATEKQIATLADVYGYTIEHVQRIVSEQKWSVEKASFYIQKALANPDNIPPTQAQVLVLERWGVADFLIAEMNRQDAIHIIGMGREHALRKMEEHGQLLSNVESLLTFADSILDN